MFWGIVLSNLFWLGALGYIINRINKHKLKEKNYIRSIELQNTEINNTKAQIQLLQEKLTHLSKLAIVAEQSENAVMLMDREGDIEWVNKSFTRMYGYSYSEFTEALGDNIRKTSFNPKIIERLNRCVNLRQAVTYEALNITKSGREIWTHTSLVPLLDEYDNVIGLATIDSDIHNRIAASETLIKHVVSSNLKLEKITEQLNFMVDLTNALFERIDKSQERIEKTNQIISYVKGISDQTKILGINASIEAHSAGNHGHGFRIIANEIVSISNRTIQALKEINDLIVSIKRSSDKLSNERERSEAAIGLHRELIEEMKQNTNEIEEAITRLKV
jgi:PAS domain S-box-containing protein